MAILRGYGKRDARSVGCYLIGQLARNDAYSPGDITGEEIVSMIKAKLSVSRDIVGGRFVKELGDLLIAFLASHASKVIVLVAGLRLAGKGSPKVLFGLGACKLIGHRNISLLCIRGFI